MPAKGEAKLARYFGDGLGFMRAMKRKRPP